MYKPKRARERDVLCVNIYNLLSAVRYGNMRKDASDGKACLIDLFSALNSKQQICPINLSSNDSETFN